MPIKYPIAVLISDVHYNVHTLELADAAMNAAISAANQIDVPLICCGDVHDTKANIRAECVERLRKTLDYAIMAPVFLVGNHDKVNEKSEEHALHFIEDKVNFLVSEPRKFSIEDTTIYMAGYQHDTNKLKSWLKSLPKGSIVILHQGITTANSGDYFQDHTALSPEDVTGLRIISGHYHTRQTIPLPDGGKWDYVGNPFTLTFGEANDPAKGFQILYNDGSAENVPINLRKHVKLCFELDESGLFDGQGVDEIKPGDLVWIQVFGPKEFLRKVSKETLKDIIPGDFRLDLVPTDKDIIVSNTVKNNPVLLLDSIIDGTSYTTEYKASLKEFWRKITSD